MQAIQRITEEFAIKNMSTLLEGRLQNKLTLKELSQRTGISTTTLHKYEKGALPSPRNYNELSKIFGWGQVKITKKKKKKTNKEISSLAFHAMCVDIHKNEEAELKRKLEQKEKVLSFIFEVGKYYKIKEKREKHDIKNFDELSYVFRYEGKQGIHHCFREIHGGWTRTYADVQLIGKTIKEVNNE